MLDTKGPEIRTGYLKKGLKFAEIKRGDEVEISINF
jgi:pyruvate kinase